MMNTAVFSFHDSLKDMLPADAGTNYPYLFNGAPSVKDAIEAMGIPHTEVDVIVVNDQPVNFEYRLQNKNQVTVYPHGSVLSNQYSISGNTPVKNGFIVDAHLGSLVRTLRLLGLDAFYDNAYTEAAIAGIASSTNRIVITRSLHLLKHKHIKWGYWVRSHEAEAQVSEVIKRFNLKHSIQPFKHCMVCNGLLVTTDKQSVIELLPPKTRQYFNEFWKCDSCHKIYWKGSHYEHMQLLVRRIEAAL